MFAPAVQGCQAVKHADKATAAKIAISSAGKSVASVLRKRPTRRRNTGSKSLWKSFPKSLWKSQSSGLDGSAAPEVAQERPDGGRCDGKATCASDEEGELSLSMSDASTTGSLEDQADVRSSSGSENPGASTESDRDADDHPEAVVNTWCQQNVPMWEDEDLYQRWESVLKGRPTTELPSEELRCLVEFGMPLKYRHQLWQHWCATAEVGDIDSLQPHASAAAAHQIDLDVPRTWPQWLGVSDRASLRRVLRAYAAHNPTVGYCQGMSNMAAVFVVLGFDEAAALRGLSSICDSCCPDYFCPSLEGYLRDVAVLGVLVRELLSPDIAQRLDTLNIPLNMLAADHFLTLASHTWPLGSVVRLWDLFLLEGSPAVFASFLSLLQLYLPEKRGDSEASELVDAFLKATTRGVAHDLDTILDMTRELIPSIPRSRIEILRYVFAGKARQA